MIHRIYAVLMVVYIIALLPLEGTICYGASDDNGLQGVASAMRKFNARHKVLRGHFVSWGNCSTCDGGAPIPPKPGDSFFDEVSRHKAVQVVQSLSNAFYSSELYAEFYELEGQVPEPQNCDDTEFDTYDADDFPTNWPGGPTIDCTNYEKAAEKLCSYIDKLNTITIYGSGGYTAKESHICPGGVQYSNQSKTAAEVADGIRASLQTLWTATGPPEALLGWQPDGQRAIGFLRRISRI